MNRIEVIQYLIDAMSGRTYLEIGVEAGNSFIPIKVERKIAVDPSFEHLAIWKRKASILAKEALFFELTSDEFFERHASLFQNHPIDFAFIDGLHTYEQSLKDVNNCLRWLSSYGVIVMHDCSPSTEIMAFPAKSVEDAEQLNLPEWTGEWCGDVWKTIVNLRSTRSDLHVFVLNCDYGIGLVRKGVHDNSQIYSEEEIARMTYRDLDTNRASLLDLREEDYFFSYLDQLRIIRSSRPDID